MIFRFGVIASVVFLAACQSGVVDPSVSAQVSSTAAPAVTPTSEWSTLSRDSVDLRIRTPDGWAAITDDAGILLAEHSEFTHDGVQADGLLIYIFIPEMDKLDIPVPNDPENMAFDVLNYVTEHANKYLEGSVASTPQPFVWHEHPAAYYLLSDRHDNSTLVVAVELPGNQRLIVCNISTPASEAHRIREVLPTVFENLYINDEQISTDALDSLPDPLVFPRTDLSE